MPSSHHGGLMPDDRAEVIIQGVAQYGDRGLLIERSTDQMTAALRICSSTPACSWYTRGTLICDAMPMSILPSVGASARAVEGRR